MEEIKITEIDGIKIGQVEDEKAATGVSVILCEKGMAAGLDVRGGGPASRESELMNPLAAAQEIHAVVLSGGSAFGLDAAGGVMEFLEEKNIGFDVGVTKVPLVCQADIFDLTVGDSHIRPDKNMGYEAAKKAFEGGNYKDGNFGAGCGASVGKIMGMDFAMKSGIGSYAISIGDFKIGAIVCLNALGDIFDYEKGEKIAGLLREDKKSFRSTLDIMCSSLEVKENKFVGNTTIACVITNGKFDKTKLCKIAGMAHNGYARSINPVHTSCDGDSIYAVSVGDIDVDQDLAGSLAALVISKAIEKAVKCAKSAYGLLAYDDINMEG
ncbi:L-aminopeptidase/D-esterase [Acetitomaculum ruminis DSM 5522]|uniref:L-aminopeptidase/D-esterase n=1 Tax=Acetitomaculum ruminis DSM 5522 TaxID=1120918 RepID=A0A1I0W4A3_9FIRM|nr:P1 family peptidase [Acetitomaculum ruminis]SFA83575.1 L-aminopeptidase/D-esterase [Acetitomaculum ruminis DSM 5522]